jgi:superfamily II DNA or RNA helicase
LIGAEPIPEVGQLVEVRGRHWVVSEVIPSALPPDPLAGETARQHLLTLSSVEDDALSEELQVVWEAEVGRRIRERATLPDVTLDGFDDPSTLAAFLDAVRWGAVTSAERDTLQAPFRSGISIEDYQLDPLVRALGQPRVNLLIADDVGIGKTIEAGLIAQELLLRHRVRRVMVVCPATLTLKWKAEMAEKFGLDFTIIDSDRLKDLRRTHGISANPFRVHPLTIVSLQWLPGQRAQRILKEVLPSTPTYPRAFDLLIVDEAHHVAPKAPKASYAVDSEQTKAMRDLAEHFEHHLFLSATPHNGYRESWTALLALVDPLRFARGVEPDPAARRQVVVRRMKDEIKRADGTPRFPKREVHALPVTYTKDEGEAHQLLQSFVERRRARADRSGVHRNAVDIATLLLKKRLFSSPHAFARTLERFAETLRRKTHESATVAPVPSWLVQLELAGQEEGDDDARTEAEQDQLARASDFQHGLTETEDDLLRRLIAWARNHGDHADTKANRLIELLESTCRPGGHWNDERVVVFTEYRDTQKWLAELLEAHGLGGVHLQLLYGGQDEDERERIKNAFQAEPRRAPVRILLGTDAAGEGIDLQLHCYRVVNYDIPFNPNRLEQRIGRVDRHGQQHRPQAYHFVGAGWENSPAGSFERDLEFLSRVARKVATQVGDLGSINAILESAIQKHMVGDLSADFDPLEITTKAGGQELRAERDLRERVEALGQRVRQSIEDLQVAPANVQRVVSTALSLAHQPPLLLAVDPKTGTNDLYNLPIFHGIWARAAERSEDPLTGEPRPITFDRDRVTDRQDLVLAHLGHPLVAMSTRLLRAAVWGAEHGGLYRVTACTSRDGSLEAPVLAAFSRLVLMGADGSRLHEEVFAAGGWMREQSFSALGVTKLSAILDGALGTSEARPVPTEARKRLAERWPSVKDQLITAIAARASEREQSLRGRLSNLREQEAKNLDEAIGAFRQTLERALAEPGWQQMELQLSDPDERSQLRRDVESWRSILERLDSQRDSELAEINRRYADVRTLTFPAAVVFVLPGQEAVR